MTTEHPRIVLDPKVLTGKPVIRGTRLSVEFIIGLMADGWSEADILANYPGVMHEDIIACLRYARDTLSLGRRCSRPPAGSFYSACRCRSQVTSAVGSLI